MENTSVQQISNIQIDRPHGRPVLLDVLYPDTPDDKPVVIFCHGFKGFKDWGTFGLVGRQIANAGYVFIKMNFSHNGIGTEGLEDFGDLEGFSENTLSKEMDDLGAVIDWCTYADELLEVRADPKKIALIGHSRGGGICICKAAEDKRVSTLITWAAVYDFSYNMGEEELQEWEAQGVRIIPNARTGQDMPMKYDYVKDYFENKSRLDIQAQASALTQPTLIVHGTEDEALPFEGAIAFKKNVPRAKLCLVPAASHTFNMKHPFEDRQLPFNAQVLMKETLHFLQEHNR